MASDNHYLLPFFASKKPINVFIKTIPLLLFYGYFLFSVSLSTTELIFFISGIISWGFFEYIIHRFVYHKRSKFKKLQWFLDAFHLHHHKNLKDYRVLNAGLFIIYPLSIIIFTVSYLITKDVVLTCSFSLGMTLYYMFYEYIHYQIHNKIHTNGYLKMIQKYHLYHHYNNWNSNFGNTIPFWDRIFKTYNSDYKNIIFTNEQIEDLIKKK